MAQASKGVEFTAEQTRVIKIILDRAVTAAVRAIDQWCYSHPNECEPPIR
jgi:hypothetical protein